MGLIKMFATSKLEFVDKLDLMFKDFLVKRVVNNPPDQSISSVYFMEREGSTFVSLEFRNKEDKISKPILIG